IQGDAAGALLIQRAAPESGGLRILDAETRRVPHRSQPGITESDESWASTLTKLIDLLLARNGLRRNQINDVIGHQGMPSLSVAVHSHLDRPAVRERREESAHLGAAESIVRLAQTPDCLAPRHDRRTLLWGFGIGGFIGAALLEARGMPFQDRRSTRRSAS
ncbi:MAG: 3-oxoacyl-ACP synthase, partial [Paraburkholderia sp.]